ncbi:hypothetical protein [Nocardia amikacinitolerans]|uniref:hypothetical protein n=1 Tax=Nocardia amikacinitolerans TaxID=756689 RepID=UPI0020A47A16|nr:hypothetical protein [Nocardia amikacinitolerans]MCP2276190.1 hypothetical protein [Nocardia amikacinitolerans]
MGWRSTASQQAQNDLDTLLRDSVTAVARTFETADSFDPFMLVVDIDGNTAIRKLPPGNPATRTEQQFITAVQLANDRERLRARVAVFDVTATAPITGDAIKALLEHREGIAIDVLVPYAITSDSLDIRLAAANAAVGTPRLWG